MLKKTNFSINTIMFIACTILTISCKKSEPVSSIDPITENSKNPVKISSVVDGIYDVLGYGYNVLGEYANSSSATFKIIDIDALKLDYPDRVETDLSSLQDSYSVVGENSVTYTKGLSAKFSYSWGFNADKALFGSTIKANFADSSWGDSKYLYGSYFLKIKRKKLKFNASYEMLRTYAVPSFVSDVQNQTPAYIVAHYGTHLLSNIDLGAKLEVIYRSETNNSNRTSAASIGLDHSVLGIFNLHTGLNTSSSSTSGNFSQSLHYKTYGGDPSLSLVGTLTFNNVYPTINIAAWQATSTVANAELIDIDATGLIPIYELVSDPTKRAALQTYVNQYLIDNQIFLNVSYPTTEIFRGYNTKSGDRMLSAWPSEFGKNWVNEGVWGKLYSDNSRPGTVALHRFQLSNGHHFYTTSYNEIGSNGNYEGITGYIATSSSNDTRPVYRYSGGNGHFFTPNFGELGYGGNGWVYEGIIGYIPN